MKLLFIIQRYGKDVIGGAELHCRLIAQHLRQNHEVEIATTCAMDYLTWENVFPPGTTTENGIPVHRFPVAGRRPSDFDDIAFQTLFGYPSLKEQVAYIEAHGPFCPELTEYLQSRSDVDRFIFFSYRYWITYKGLQSVGSRSILVPTAEHDRTLHLPVHAQSFHRPAAIAYNSVEERDIINKITGNQAVPGDIIGVGLPEFVVDDPGTVREKFDLLRPYCVYIGRIEESKGCAGLVENYIRCFRDNDNLPDLVMIGKQHLEIPVHSGIRVLGPLDEAEKNAVLSKALFLVMPSRFESLSMVVLEAWRQKLPVLCNGDCEVLRGQCFRANGGLYYRNADEFTEALNLLANRPDIRRKFGSQGYDYFVNNYSWPLICEKYDRLLAIRNESIP